MEMHLGMEIPARSGEMSSVPDQHGAVESTHHGLAGHHQVGVEDLPAGELGDVQYLPWETGHCSSLQSSSAL